MINLSNAGQVQLTALTIPDESVGEEPLVVPAVAPTYLVPSLRGKLLVEGTTHVCKGVWALSDDHHSLEGQTSEFEFKLVKPSPDNTRAFPVNGKYQGYFYLKQPPPLKSSLKIEDKDMNISFTEKENGEYAIDGEGSNKFGKFSLRGTLSADGSVQMYRIYVAKPIIVKRQGSGAATPTSARKRPLEAGTNTPSAAIAIDTSRTRKKSNLGDDHIVGDAFSPRSSEPVGSPRASRLSQHLLKCSEMLKEIVKQPQSVWFMEPVDPIKLNIPDYPLIVKEPMDFGTIRANLERNFYSGPEAFAEHVRLVFKNALTYNQLRDHPVHIAAREMSSKFEERYRLLLSQLGLNYEADAGVPSTKKSKGPRLSTSYAAPKSRQAYSHSPGPRSTDVFLPPPLDNSAHHLAEMQRRMEEMRNEIMKLRTEVKQNELRIGATNA